MDPRAEKKIKVAIVDDDEDIRAVYSRKFTEEGFEVTTASNGAAGIRLLETNKPDVLLLDINMPLTSGSQVLELVKNDQVLAQLPLVVFTNMSPEEIQERFQSFPRNYHVLYKAEASPKQAVEFVRDVLLKGNPMSDASGV
jgi:CheY-like chemotaxis protein